MSCSVLTCRNVRRLLPPGSNITFHQFPRDKRYQEYLRILGKKPTDWKATMLICSKHFKDEDFRLLGEKKYLKGTAIPSIKIQLDTETETIETVKSIQETNSNCSNKMNICRACMTEGDLMTSLFSCYKAYPMMFTFSEIFTNCTSLQVNKDDGLPTHLCSDCVLKLKQWFTFKETSMKSDVKLRNAASKNVANELDNLSILHDDNRTDMESEGKNSINKTSPLFFLVINDDDDDVKEGSGNDETKINEKELINEMDCDEKEVGIELPTLIQEKNLSISENLVQSEDEENLRSVKKDHAYANKKKLKQPLKSYYYCQMCLDIFTSIKKYKKHISQEHGITNECKHCHKILHPNDISKHICCVNTVSEDGDVLEPTEKNLENTIHTNFGQRISSKHTKYLDPSKMKQIVSATRQARWKKSKMSMKSECDKSKVSDVTEKVSATKRLTRKDPIKCTHCGKIFKSLWRLKTHMLTHTGERPHMCHICGKTFSQKPHLKTHYFTHTGIKNYICEMCGKKFATLSFLKSHMRYHDDKTKKHRCTECSKSFFLPCELKAHIRTHTGERPFKCVVCSKSFRLKAAMKTHQLRHGSCELQDIGRSYWCNMCNRTFTREIYLENHVASVHGGEHQNQKFTCKICGREFRTKNTLKMHSIRHTSSRPFLCTICNRNFKAEVNLISHIKFHARPKPFECETCHKRFIDRCALRVHNRTHTGERPFACELCEKRFTVKRSLEAHVRCHTGERPFICSICKNAFTQRCSLQTHMLLMHNCDP